MSFALHPVLIDVPMPIRTPRLLIRPYREGDGALTAEAIAETWDDLHERMLWADRLEDNSAVPQEIRTRQVMAAFLLRQELSLLAVDPGGRPVVWCGYHHLDWPGRQCELGYWTRKTAQGLGYATEAANALVRYGFAALGMRRLAIAHAGDNERSRRVIAKLGFAPEGLQRAALQMPGERFVDRCSYARMNADGLPDLEVSWG